MENIIINSNCAQHFYSDPHWITNYPTNKGVYRVGRSENCIFHNRNYPECFFHSFINNKKGEIEKK